MPYTLPHDPLAWLEAGESATGEVTPGGAEGVLNRPLVQLLANDDQLLTAVNDLETLITGLSTTQINTIINTVYPVGSLFFNAATPNHPGTLFGVGTWQAYGQGRVLVGVGTGNDGINPSQAFSLGQTGGEYKHLLTEAEMPTHDHTLEAPVKGGQTGSQNFYGGTFGTNPPITTTEAGGDQPHNIVQPYISVHIFRRTA